MTVALLLGATVFIVIIAANWTVRLPPLLLGAGALLWKRLEVTEVVKSGMALAVASWSRSFLQWT